MSPGDTELQPVVDIFPFVMYTGNRWGGCWALVAIAISFIDSSLITVHGDRNSVI